VRDALQRFLDGEHREVRDRVRETLRDPQFRAPAESLPKEEYRELVLEWAKALAARGDTLLGLPVEFGGGGDVAGSIAAFATLAHGDLSLLVKCGVQFGLFGGAILHLGNPAQQAEYLPKVASVELPGCFAMTETGHGSNVQGVRTTATYDADAQEFVIDTPDEAARKDYIGNAAAHGRMAAVFAQLSVGGEGRGVHALLVPLRDDAGEALPDVRIEDCGEKLGLNGVDNGRLYFDGVRVPRTALLDHYAQVTEAGEYVSEIENPNRRFFTMVGTLIQGRVSICGAAVTASKTAQAIAVRYALLRRQFGPPGGGDEIVLLDYRTHQRRLLPALATTYALHVAQDRVVAELDKSFDAEQPDPIERRALETRAAGLKAIATWHATETIQTCRECCGGAGYLAENRFAALKADTDVFTTFEGDNTVLLQLVAKSLLTGYGEEFESLDPIATVGFIAGQILDAVVERSAVGEIFQRVTDDLNPFRDSDDDLLDRPYQLEQFRWREEHMLSGVARRIRGGMEEEGADAFAVFNNAQDHLVATARAHVEREVLELFTEAIEACEDEAARGLLDGVCDLYALGAIERDRAWFQEHGRMSSSRAKALTRTVNDLCAELREHALTLVEAFGIPDEVLAAPIAFEGATVETRA
jgi:acyl-CoA oxidase